MGNRLLPNLSLCARRVKDFGSFVYRVSHRPRELTLSKHQQSTRTAIPPDQVPHREANITGTMEMTVPSTQHALYFFRQDKARNRAPPPKYPKTIGNK
eukprot:4735642-Amphidinium_carterae.2